MISVLFSIAHWKKRIKRLTEHRLRLSSSACSLRVTRGKRDVYEIKSNVQLEPSFSLLPPIPPCVLRCGVCVGVCCVRLAAALHRCAEASWTTVSARYRPSTTTRPASELPLCLRPDSHKQGVVTPSTPRAGGGGGDEKRSEEITHRKSSHCAGLSPVRNRAVGRLGTTRAISRCLKSLLPPPLRSPCIVACTHWPPGLVPFSPSPSERVRGAIQRNMWRSM